MGLSSFSRFKNNETGCTPLLDKPSVLASNGYFQRSPTTSSSYRSEAPHCLISENSFKVAPPVLSWYFNPIYNSCIPHYIHVLWIVWRFLAAIASPADNQHPTLYDQWWYSIIQLFITYTFGSWMGRRFHQVGKGHLWPQPFQKAVTDHFRSRWSAGSASGADGSQPAPTGERSGSERRKYWNVSTFNLRAFVSPFRSI